MTRDEFIQGKLFMFSDIDREIELAKADGNALQAVGVRSGGGNFLAALGVYALVDPEAAVAEVEAEALIKSTGRIYLQDYVVFLRAAGGKIAFLREYFDPVRAAKALDTPILGLES
jgi:hypothetical protein